MIKYLFCMFCIFQLTISCQEKEEYIKIVIQPQLKIKESINFEIYFKELPDKGTVEFEKSNDYYEIEEYGALVTDTDESNGISTYKYMTYFTPKKNGVINLPKVSAVFNGIKHVSKQYKVEVLEDILITDDAVITELKSNKKNYRLKDTITIELFEYNRFTNTKNKPIENEPKSVLPEIHSEKGELK